MFGIGQQVSITAIDSLIGPVNELLRCSRFFTIDRGEWQRKVVWRCDEVDLRIRDVNRKGIQPALRVAIPQVKESDDDDDLVYIAEAKLPRIINPSAPAGEHIALPILHFGIRRFVEHFVQDLESALLWFDQFATPALCRSNLPKFIKPGCPAFLKADNYFRTLIDSS